MADKIKLTAGVLLALAGVAGYYLMSSSATVVRLAVFIAGLLAGGAVAWFTTQGQQFFGFARESVTETKKVAWPTRKEVVNSTIVVLIAVVVMTTLIFLFDYGSAKFVLFLFD